MNNSQDDPDDLSLKFLGWPPPLSENLFGQLEKGFDGLERSDTGLIVYETIDIAKKVCNDELPLRLPRELVGLPLLIVAGSSTGSLEADVPYRIVGTLSDTKVAPRN
jgi:hypothetical protein